jgi:hypothetical protein
VISNGRPKALDKENTSNNFSVTGAEDSVSDSKEILEALLVHEKQQESSTSALSFLQNQSQDMTLDHEMNGVSVKEEVMESDDEDMEEVPTPMVRVGGQYVPLHDINDDHIKKMSSLEKEDYIRLTQEMYAHLYE